jgi:predicted lysophospholipase L1 biosynthesis ABC-type transport system permease subunit
MISERLARRLWPATDAIGERLKLGKPEGGPNPDWMTIVGIVADVRHQALEGEAGPDLYLPSLQLAWKQMHYLVRARDGVDPRSLIAPIRGAVAEVAPEVGVFNFVLLHQEVSDSLWQSRLRTWLFGFFSLVALSLAATGLYGTMAHGVAHRTREIGIRLALGASRRSVLGLVLGQGMRAVAIGLVTGIGGAVMVSRVLNAMLFGVSANDLTSYGIACLLLAGTAGIAAFIPARRASLINPMEALRAE